MLDFDLAEMYGTENKYLKRSVNEILKGSKVNGLYV